MSYWFLGLYVLLNNRGDTMSDYKSMYYILFNQISKTIEELQDIQKQVEQMYIESELINLTIINKYDKNEE